MIQTRVAIASNESLLIRENACVRQGKGHSNLKSTYLERLTTPKRVVWAGGACFAQATVDMIQTRVAIASNDSIRVPLSVQQVRRRNNPVLIPYSRTMPRVVWRSFGGEGVRARYPCGDWTVT